MVSPAAGSPRRAYARRAGRRSRDALRLHGGRDRDRQGLDTLRRRGDLV